MTCALCGVEMAARMATDEAPYKYESSGLQDVFLSGIKVFACPQCKTESPIIPRISQLHKLIAEDLIQQERLLRWDEIRFLRKHAGFPAKEFATLLRVSQSYFSKVENGAEKLSPTGDKLVRAIATQVLNCGEMREVLLSHAGELIKRKSAARKYQLKRNTWKLAAA